LGHANGVHEAATGGVHVHRRAVQSEFVGEHRRRRRAQSIRGGGRHHQEVDVTDEQSGVFDGVSPGDDAERDGRAADSSFTDAGAFGDPLVGGVERLGELVVGDDLVR